MRTQSQDCEHWRSWPGSKSTPSFIFPGLPVLGPAPGHQDVEASLLRFLSGLLYCLFWSNWLPPVQNPSCSFCVMLGWKKGRPRSSFGIWQRKPVNYSPEKDVFLCLTGCAPLEADGRTCHSSLVSRDFGDVVWKTAHKVICGPPRSGGSWWPRSLALFHAHRCNALDLVSTIWGVLVPKTLTGLWCPSKTPGWTQQPAAPALTGGHHTWCTLTPPPPACPLFSSVTLVSSWHAVSESQRTNSLLANVPRVPQVK